MKNNRQIVLGVILGIASFLQPAAAGPIVNISDLSGPITVTGSGFLTFSGGTINGNPEAVWWTGTLAPLALGNSSSYGIWTEPGSTKISDEYAVFTSDTGITAGIFFSSPFTLPASFTIPGFGTVDLSKFASAISSAETGLPTQISPDPSRLSVTATSSVADGGSTWLMLGLGLLGIVGFSRHVQKASPSLAARPH